MKKRNPSSRRDLRILSNYRVLEVGGGHNPHPRSNIVCDKFIDTNYHRSGDIKVRKNQEFLQADGENLPFRDKEFDYVICNQVLEHVDNPEKFLKEQMRVAKRGYLEAPSLFGEYLFPKESHRWLILEINNKIVMVEKKDYFRTSRFDISDIFLHHLANHSLAYKMLTRNYPCLYNTAIEWEEDFEFIVNPTEERYLKYFDSYWSGEMIREFFPVRSKPGEVMAGFSAFFGVFTDFFRNSLNRQ